MELLLKIIESLKSLFSDKMTLARSRRGESDFTRNEKLPFFVCLVYGMAHFTGSLAYGIDEFFAEESGGSESATGSAYSKARKNFTELPYREGFELTRDIILKEYTESGEIQKLHGKTLIAVDGSLVPLPNNQKLLEKYGGLGPRKKNPGRKIKKSPTARLTVLFDPLNEVIYEAALDPINVGERLQAMRLIEKMGQYMDLSEVAFVFDRGCISESFVKKLDSLGAGYIFRVKKSFSPHFDKRGLGDHTVNFHGKRGRLIKFKLDSPAEGAEMGETEMILTNLWEPKAEEFKEIYFLRWGIEVEYDTIKNKIGLTSFTGTLDNSIRQDFWICMILANIASVVKKTADGIIANRPRRHKVTKHEYVASMSEVVNGLKIDLPEALMADTEEEMRRRLRHLLAYASENIEPIRPGRSFIRGIARDVRSHYNRKRH